MAKVALVFPGQGAQYTGMARELYEGNKVAKNIIDTACKELNMDLKSMMFEGPDEELSKTENTQPAILTHSIAAFEALNSELDLDFDVCLGLSLGEYSALVAAGLMEFKDAVKLVKKRGRYMQDTVPLGEGTMAAILGMDRPSLNSVIDEIACGVVEVANYNSPGQIVISGETEKVREAMEKCKSSGAKKAVELSVSGPFHSSMLEEAGKKLSSELDKISIKDSNIKVVSNVNADYYDGNCKDLLVKQVSSSVLWEDSISRLIDEGYDTFIEIGPGKTLKAFIKKISSQKDAKVDIHNIDDIDSFDKFVNNYRNGEI